MVNGSAVSKTNRRGTKVALGTFDFEEFSAAKETINLLSSPDVWQTQSFNQSSDPVTILASQMTHSPPLQFHEAKTLLI